MFESPQLYFFVITNVSIRIYIVVKADGSPLVAGIDFTCFTDSEEAAVGATDSIPFSMQQKMTELGGKFSGGADWGSTVVESGNVVFGQNPASSTACAQAVVSKVK